MSDANFDPYHEWLGIPPDEQPANHYRLLGLELFEDDRGVIESVSLEQIAHIRTFAIGANSEQSQLLLNELSAARVTLLNLAQKAEYDQDLRQQLNIAPPPVDVISESTQQTVNTPTVEDEAATVVADSDQMPFTQATSDSAIKLSLYIRVGLGSGLIVGVLVFVMLYLRSEKVTEAVYQALNQGDYEAALELDPGNEQALKMRGNAELLSSALNRRDYREVLRLDPTNAQGIALKNAADLRQALADGDATRALLLAPGNPQALALRASNLKQSLAEGDYKRVLAIDPNHLEALAMMKSVKLQQALVDGDYKRALRLDPANSVALSMKLSAEIKLAIADGDYVYALSLDPTNAAALGLKKSADIAGALGDGDYTRALLLDPTNAAALAMKRADIPVPAITPFDTIKAKEHQEVWADFLGVEVETENSIGMKLRVIPPGKFTMGAGSDAHEVTLTKPFSLGTYEVTQAQYEQVMGVNPSNFKGAYNPVEKVSWNDAIAFCRKLSALPTEAAEGNVYRLPTEAEWEYACRAGTTARYSFGEDESELVDYAWFRGNSGGTTHPVGLKKANALGLYDMHGNVLELCQDLFANYSIGAATDPSGPMSGKTRVFRGGGWHSGATVCLSTYRRGSWASNSGIFVGFRVACIRTEPTSNPKLAGFPVETPVTTSAPPPANAPFDAAKAKEHQEAWAKYLGVEVETENSIGMKLRVIPAGTFMMGSSRKYQITLTQPFQIGVYEVTQNQYEQVTGLTPSVFPGDNNPVDSVSWDDAIVFCRKLSELPQEKNAGRVYRLPTQYEWRYACRAGTDSRYSFGDDISELSNYAWYQSNSDNKTHPAGRKLPNRFGLYDMHGNVAELPNGSRPNYANRSLTDPTGWVNESGRPLMGGDFGARGTHLTRHTFSSGQRTGRHNDRGFRIVCTFSDAENESEQTFSAGTGIDKTKTTFSIPSSVTGPKPAAATLPFNSENATALQFAWANYLGIDAESENSIGMKMQLIPPGNFTMRERSNIAPGAHQVTLTKPYLLGTFEVTQDQYQRLMGTNPSRLPGQNFPVDQVTWNDAVEFCERLSALPVERAAGHVYHLPTEAQWEYACCGGATTKYSFGDDDEVLTSYAWYRDNSKKQSHAVGLRQPNYWGLSDMHGNVWEWCQDWHGIYTSRALTDPSGPAKGSDRICRGGSWGSYPQFCETRLRLWCFPAYRSPFVGFRVAVTLSLQ